MVHLLDKGNNDLIWNWLALEGPAGIMNFIKEKDSRVQFEERYLNNCHLCRDIFARDETRQVLRKHAKEKVAETSFKRAVYEHFLYKEAQKRSTTDLVLL